VLVNGPASPAASAYAPQRRRVAGDPCFGPHTNPIVIDVCAG
jgi:hypothetical protein